MMRDLDASSPVVWPPWCYSGKQRVRVVYRPREQRGTYKNQARIGEGGRVGNGVVESMGIGTYFLLALFRYFLGARSKVWLLGLEIRT